MKLKIYRPLLWFQGLYTIITAVWPMVDIDSFMKVTGPKTDIWLVKTVAVILAAIGLTFLTAANQKEKSLPTAVLAISSAIGLAIIDFYYTSQKVISPVYAADGGLQLIFIVLWAVLLFNWTKR